MMMMERRDAIVDRFRKVTYESGIDSDTSLLDEIKSSVLNSPLPTVAGVLGKTALGVVGALFTVGEAAGVVMLGAASAGLSLLYFGFKGFQLYQIASMDVASQVKFLFKYVYMNNEDTSKTTLHKCIVEMFSDVKEKTQTIFGNRMPTFVTKAQASLKSVCEELKTPEEIDEQYRAINSELDQVHHKLVRSQSIMGNVGIDEVADEEIRHWSILKKGTFMQSFQSDDVDRYCILVPNPCQDYAFERRFQRDIKTMFEISRRTR